MFHALWSRATILHRKIRSRHVYVLSCGQYTTELQDYNQTPRATTVFWKRLQFVRSPTTTLFRNYLSALGMNLDNATQLCIYNCQKSNVWYFSRKAYESYHRNHYMYLTKPKLGRSLSMLMLCTYLEKWQLTYTYHFLIFINIVLKSSIVNICQFLAGFSVGIRLLKFGRPKKYPFVGITLPTIF